MIKEKDMLLSTTRDPNDIEEIALASELTPMQDEELHTLRPELLHSEPEDKLVSKYPRIYWMGPILFFLLCVGCFVLYITMILPGTPELIFVFFALILPIMCGYGFLSFLGRLFDAETTFDKKSRQIVFRCKKWAGLWAMREIVVPFSQIWSVRRGRSYLFLSPYYELDTTIGPLPIVSNRHGKPSKVDAWNRYLLSLSQEPNEQSMGRPMLPLTPQPNSRCDMCERFRGNDYWEEFFFGWLLIVGIPVVYILLITTMRFFIDAFCDPELMGYPAACMFLAIYCCLGHTLIGVGVMELYDLRSVRTYFDKGQLTIRQETTRALFLGFRKEIKSCSFAQVQCLRVARLKTTRVLRDLILVVAPNDFLVIQKHDEFALELCEQHRFVTAWKNYLQSIGVGCRRTGEGSLGVQWDQF